MLPPDLEMYYSVNDDIRAVILKNGKFPIHEIPFYQHTLQFRYYLYQYKRHQKPLPFLHVRKYIDKVLEQARVNGYVETLFGRRRPTPDVLSSNFMVRSGAERAAANMPIQGTEADLMKLSMIEVDKKLDGLGEQLLQIHDSILIECPTENADKIAEILRSTMENIAPQLGIKLKVDVSIGNNWGEL